MKIGAEIGKKEKNRDKGDRKRKVKGRERSSALAAEVGPGKKREERGHGSSAAVLSFICPWMSLGLQVGMENMHLLASGPWDVG